MYLLLVDLDLYNSDDFKEMLKHAPSRSDIISTYTADSLIKLAGKISPEIIIVDFDLIDGEVADILNNLRNLSDKAYIIALIKPDHYEKLFEAIEHAKIDDYIVKPIRKEELVARVQIASRRKPLISPGYKLPSEEKMKPEVEYSAPKIEETPFEDELNSTKEYHEKASGFNFDDDELTTLEPETEKEKDPAEDLFFTDVSKGMDQDSTPAQEISSEREEFKIYDDPDMADLFEPDELKLETKPAGQDDVFDFGEPLDTLGETGDIKSTNEKEFNFDDIEIEDDLQPKTVVQPVVEPGEEKQDLGFFNDFPSDEISASGKVEKTTDQSIDSLFDDDDLSTKHFSEEQENEFFSKEMDFGQDQESKEFEVTMPDEEDPWDFDNLDEDSVGNNIPGEADIKPVPGTRLFDKEGLFSDQDKSTTTPADINDSDSYFDELFAEDPPKSETPDRTDEYDFLGSSGIEQQPAEKNPIKPKSDLPGKSADDFLYGKGAFDDDSDDERHKTSMLDGLYFDDEEFEKPKKKGMKVFREGKGPGRGFLSFLSIFGNIVFVALLLMMATLSFFLIQSRITGGVPQVAGYQIYIVLSGSMAPEFDTGSLAFVQEIPPEKIVVGDIITFRTQAGSDSLTTHRVVEVNRQDGLKFVTRGDANSVNDPRPVLAENVVGRVTGSIPYLGYLLNFAQTRQGLILLIFVPGVLIIVYELGKIMKYLAESRRE